MRRFLHILLIVLGCFAGGAFGQAEDFVGGGDDEGTLGVLAPTMGWGGYTRAGHWMPLRVTLMGGRAAVGGRIDVTVTDGDGTTRVTAPFAATPGRATPVDLSIPASLWLRSLEIEIRDDRNRRLDRRRYPSENRVRDLPAVLAHDDVLVAVVGDCSLSRAATRPLAAEDGVVGPPTPRDAGWKQATIVRMEVDALPTRTESYSSLTALAIGGEALRTIGHPAAEAIRAWVDRGGHLIVLLDRAGVDHERLVGSEMFTAGAARRLGGDGVTNRPIELMARGATAGWRPIRRDGDVVAAEGPLGFGWVTVFGADPALLFPERTPTEAFGSLMHGGPLMIALEERGSESQQIFYRFGQDLELAASMDWIATQLDVKPFPFSIILIFLGALALLLGPIDWFALRALRLRHRSWLTALGWIGVFCLIGYIGPRVFRSGETTLVRVSAIDVAEGGTAMHSAGLTGVFLGRTSALDLEARRDETVRWWRPADEATDGAGAVIGAVPTLLERPGAAGVALAPMTGRVWTFRMFRDEAAGPGRFAVEIDAPNGVIDGDAVVRIGGIGDGSVSEAVIRTKEGLRALTRIGDSARFRVGADVAGSGDAIARRWAPVEAEELRRSFRRMDDGRSVSPAAMLRLPGAAGRTASIMHRVDAGEAAMVGFVIDSNVPDVSLAGADVSMQRSVVRALAAMPGSTRTEDTGS